MSHVEFIAGYNAGVFGVLIGHPFDTIKVKVQLTGSSPFKICKEESLRTLYKGVSSPLICLTFINAIVFGTYSNCLKMYEKEDRNKFLCQFTCGLTSGAAQSFICSPMELIKSRLQVKVKKTLLNNQKNTFLNEIFLLKQENPGKTLLQSLFRGLGATILRDAPAFAIYFSTYECFLNHLKRINSNHVKNIEIMFAGGIAGIFSWLVVYPIDVIKTQIQLNPNLTITSFLTKIYLNEGLNGLKKYLCRGLSTTIVRAFPVNAVTFYAYDKTIKFISGYSFD